MLRRLLIAFALAFAFAFALAPAGADRASAHQQKIAITIVSHNPRTGMIEIVHQVPVHDAEHALRVQGARAPDIIGSTASREAFARYIARRFLLVVDGDIITPDDVGSEITGGSLWVYQEAPAPVPPDSTARTMLRINSQILTDVWARQENRVNIGSGTAVTTFVFRAGDPPQTAPLSQ